MRVIDNRLHLPTYQTLHFSGMAYAPIEQEGNPLVLAGIAHPEYMIDHVRRQYTQAELLAYPDHHHYTQGDIDTIIDRARNYDFVITTEKDLQRLRMTPLIDRLAEQGKRLIALPVRTQFYSPQEQFDKLVLRYVKENSKRQ
jgi:tetraacyldisaccharide 4'-kinase